MIAFSIENTFALYMVFFQGAFWGLMVGFVTGVARLIIVFVFPGPEGCGDPDERPAMIKDFHYMYFGIMLFWLTVLVAVVVSMITNPPEYKQVRTQTMGTSKYLTFTSILLNKSRKCQPINIFYSRCCVLPLILADRT